MESNTVLAMMVAACFALVGVCWSAPKDKPRWFPDEAIRRLAGDVDASFLIPAWMSMGIQVGDIMQPTLWRILSGLAGVLGIYFSLRLLQQTQLQGGSPAFGLTHLAVLSVYGIVLFVALFPSLAGSLGWQPLQMEGLLSSVLLLSAHRLTWDFMASSLQR